MRRKETWQYRPTHGGKHRHLASPSVVVTHRPPLRHGLDRHEPTDVVCWHRWPVNPGRQTHLKRPPWSGWQAAPWWHGLDWQARLPQPTSPSPSSEQAWQRNDPTRSMQRSCDPHTVSLDLHSFTSVSKQRELDGCIVWNTHNQGRRAGEGKGVSYPGPRSVGGAPRSLGLRQHAGAPWVSVVARAPNLLSTGLPTIHYSAWSARLSVHKLFTSCIRRGLVFTWLNTRWWLAACD